MATKKEILNLNELLQTTLCKIKDEIEKALKEADTVCPLLTQEETDQTVEDAKEQAVKDEPEGIEQEEKE